ncbi:MAG: sulfate adenylyltransferase [Sulfurovum sp.]|nr:sulfate adenylyltransferase [Sulfurovum sp.]
MTSSKRNKTLHIDTEALSTLALVQEGLLHPVTGLMGKNEAENVDSTKFYKGIPFPFSFILAPSGNKNTKVLKAAEKDEELDLLCNGNSVGKIIVDETFKINPQDRLRQVYGTTDLSHPGVKNTLARMGAIAISGKYYVEYPLMAGNKKRIESMRQKTGAKKISSMVLSANPLNRVHERMIRRILEENDLLIIFLRKPFNEDGLSYDIRYKTLKIFIDIFVSKNKILIIPFENTYIFAGFNELILDALLACNYGCDQLVIGENHGGLGLYYDKNVLNSIFDECKNIDIDIKIIDAYVYCDICKTLVNTKTCPHGQHHHVHYHSDSILQLIMAGLVPPAILVRKEISANILASIFPNRFKNLQELYYALMPGTGLIEQQSEEQFYANLIKLHSTSSLT